MGADDDSMSDDDDRKKKDDDDDEEEDQRKSKRTEEDSGDEKKKEESSSEEEDDEKDRIYKNDDKNEKVTKTMQVEDDDAAFVLGRGGSTKRKIARVAAAEIDLDEHSLMITITGTSEQCDNAMDYINYVRQQRVGPVTIDVNSQKRNDFTAYPVPEECIGFVMGRGGQTLRGYEEEWGVLMFFARGNKKEGAEDGGKEILCIFGPFAARRGAELKVMSSVEHKTPGFCVSSKGDLRTIDRAPGDENEKGWSTDSIQLSEDNFSYALGAQGSTRRKLAAASGCIIEYVGRLACFSGYKKARRRGKDYLRWLIEQRTGQSVVESPEKRDDCSTVKIPMSAIAFITGQRGEALRAVERESATFCFTDGDRNDMTRESETLLIFSHSKSSRDHAVEIVEDRISQHKRIGSGGNRGGGGGSSRGGDRRDDDRDRSRRDNRSRSRDRRGGDRRRRDDSDDDRRDRRGGGDRRRRDDSDDDRRDRSRRDRSRSRERRGRR